MAQRRIHNPPPFCPNSNCPFHSCGDDWHFKRIGFFLRRTPPYRIQRFLCLHCHRSFSTQTFSATYWLKKPRLLPSLLYRLLSCSAYRQIAREMGVAHATVMGQAARLGRHCLLFQHLHRPKGPLQEPLVIDGFESFEFSQYHPIHFHVAVGANSHFFYAFTDSELRRKGRMTAEQKARRAWSEGYFGRPDPKSIEKEVAELLAVVVPEGGEVVIRSDEHTAYPRAFRRRPRLKVRHRVTPSVRARTSGNPLFPVNLLDGLIRHSQANHKRETIAFSKRRQSGAERLAILQVWRNFMKSFSENKGDGSPAERFGLMRGKLKVVELLARRLFPSRVGLPARLQRYYERRIETRRIPNGRRHELRYAF
jgi:transposase-like protein